MRFAYSFILVVLFSVAITTTGFCKTELIAAYAFDDGKANDVTGNGNDGEIKAAKSVDGKLGKALEFDGVTSQVVIKSKDSLNFKDGVTVEAWVKPSKYNALSAVVQKWGDGTNRRQYLLCFVGDKATMYISGAGNTWPAAAGKTAVKTGEWTHIAGTYDKKVIKTYVNGKLDGEIANTEGLFTSDVPAWIGGYGEAGNADFADNRHFPGVVDEVQYWNGALTDVEIQQNMGRSVVIAVDRNGKLATKWGSIKKVD